MLNKKLYELTNPQKSIWYTEQFYSGTNINNIVGYLKIDKNANLKALEKALNIFISKNDSFKIKLSLEDGSPKQFFDDFVYESVEILNLENESELKEFEETFPQKTININNNFLFLPKLLSFPNGSAILVLSTHHLISDAWTMSLCLEEIYQNYLSLISSEEISDNPNPSYADFIESERNYLTSSKFEKDRIYWEEKFNTLPGILSFNCSANSSIHSNRKIYTLNERLITKIKKYCSENSISDYVFLLNIFGIYFKNISNLSNFILGNPILNRSNFKEKHTTGMFVSVMPFTLSIDDNISFSELCTKTAIEQKQMYRHIRYPYHEILNYIRNTHNFSDNLYDVVFSYQNEAIPAFCKWLHNHSQAESLQIHIKSLNKDQNSLSIHYDFLTDIFSNEDIDALHSRILSLISQALDKKNINVSDFEITSNDDKKLLKNFNKTHVRYNKNSNIVKEFEAIAKLNPNRIAVKDSKDSLTYKQLNEKANYLADKILALNIQSNIIAFSLPRSINIIVTILAILKSGHTYMPIDSEYPIDRINYMLENSKTDLLITIPNFLKTINYDKKVIDFTTLTFDTIVKNPKVKISSDRIAYMMYTSGSTGVPKAVTIKHYNVLNFTKSMQERLNYKYSQSNNVLSVTTVCFDIFVFEVFPTLLSGLTLTIANEIEAKSPKLLSELIQKNKISKILTTPSRIDLLFEKDSYLKKISSIKEFILGGEPLNKIQLERLQKLTNAKIYDLYGPTETTVYSTFKDLSNEIEITIGKPINNTQIFILNSYNKLMPIGQVGEICIGGDGVGAGYYDNPEKNSLVFIENPYNPGNIIYKTGDLGIWNKNGELICLGREDHQVKIRGFRVELDDISTNILNYENIEKCAVALKEHNNKQYLCAYYVSSTDIDISKLRDFLITTLPNYMIPNYFIKMDVLPLTINHKIDKKALPMPDFNEQKSKTPYIAPTTETQKNICKVFRTTLKIKKIGITADIFDYNLDSLELIKIQTNMLDYNYQINTQDFYKYRTIEKLSEFIDNKSIFNYTDIDEDYLSNVNKVFDKHPINVKYAIQDYKNVLLTGATGYLGIHILNELLENTNYTISCLVRGKVGLNAKSRLEKTYKFYFNKNLEFSRIHIYDSDITSPNFGLASKTYNALISEIDVILNTAANVRYYGDYNKFKKINVDLVDALSDIAISKNIKLYHISTLGVSGNYLVNHEKNFNDFSENDFYIGQNFHENVYIQTKFEAEELIYSKIKKGLKATIIRVGNLTGRFKDGVFQENIQDNAFYNILRMILKYKIVPNTMTNSFLEFTPVDLCAQAVRLLISKVDNTNLVYHLFNNNYINVEEALTMFNEFGYSSEILSGNKFKTQILNLSKEHSNENILKGIINDLDDELGLSFNSTVNQLNSYTNYYLEKLDFEWNKIDNTYINKILTYMKKNKYI